MMQEVKYLQDMQEAVAEETRHILSFGCGVNTAALMVLLVEREMPFDTAVFADTGGELPETYAYLEVARRYLEDHGKELVVVKSRTSTLYDTCVRREVFPSQTWRWCTRDYKVTPIHAYYRTLRCHIDEYMGIAYDEIHRMKESKDPSITIHYPLINLKVTRRECGEIIRKAGLPVPVKSGCYFCPFNNTERWKQIHEVHPNLFQKAIALEESSKHFPEQTLTPRSLRELVRLNFKLAGMKSIEDEPCGSYCMV